MDPPFVNNSKEHPRKSAGLFSIITFFYNFPIIKKGKRKDLEEKDVYKVLPEFEAEKLGDKLQKAWESEKQRNPDNPLIWKCIVRCFGWMYLFYAIVQLIFGTLVILLQPRVVSKFIAYFEPNQTTISLKYAYSFGFGVVGINLLNTLFKTNLSQLVTEYAMKIRTSVCSLIYRKALIINHATFSDVTIGKTVTLMTKDVFSIDGSCFYLKDMFIGVLQILVVACILYNRVGVSALPAGAVFLVIIPFQLFIGVKTSKNRFISALRTDERFRIIQEALSAVKIIKMFSWQKYFEKNIHAARLKETQRIKVVFYLKSLTSIIGGVTINAALYMVLISYVARGHQIQAETIYFVQQCLFLLKETLGTSIPMGIAQTADAIAALKRIQKFLRADEIKTTPTEEETSIDPTVFLDKVKVTIRNKPIIKSASLDIYQDGLILIAGHVGSGKTALLKTILGEYPVSNGNRIVRGTFSYATEEPWVFPSTIRQNILFGQQFNKERYNIVLNLCALSYDISQFEKLDQTVIGDKGINLSKGQQARITLARAIYKDSDIYVLDDCLSSIDNHVNNHIFNECIKGFLKDKICILVTNNGNHIKSMKNNNIVWMENGVTPTLHQQSSALDKRITYYIDEENEKRDSRLLTSTESIEDQEDYIVDSEKLLRNDQSENKTGNLYYEQNRYGGVLWKVYGTYFRFIGGVFVSCYLFVVYLGAQFTLSYSEKLISLWAKVEPQLTELAQKNATNSTEYINLIDQRGKYLNIYTILLLSGPLVYVLRSYSTFFVCMNGARKLHKAMVRAMLNARLSFYDNHFIGHVINRLSKDFHSIDEYMPFLTFECWRIIFAVGGVIILVGSVNWTFFFPAAFLFVKFYIVEIFYLPTGRSLRRLEAATRSPIIGYLNSTLEGLLVVRAANQSETCKMEFDRHQDLFTSSTYMIQTTQRFFGLILNVFGLIFLLGIILKLLLFPQGADDSEVGLAISQAMLLAGLMEHVIRLLAEVESVMTSVERVMEYADVKTEGDSGKVLKNWPSNGIIQFENVSLTYESHGQKVLKNISFKIDRHQRIGIVGRTGAGKSSIISTLFRLYNYEGNIFIDNENIRSISLDFLRSHISIIPQDPVLFSGTIRSNIDPYHKYSDKLLWSALENVHMKQYVESLNSKISDVNLHYSSGQRQLLCLARTLIQNNKIIVLDEATANLDPETEAALDNVLEGLFQDCTVIIIAHRLNSIMNCDKVMVVDAGQIAEYDAPTNLINNKNSLLSRMLNFDKNDGNL